MTSTVSAFNSAKLSSAASLSPKATCRAILLKSSVESFEEFSIVFSFEVSESASSRSSVSESTAILLNGICGATIFISGVISNSGTSRTKFSCDSFKAAAVSARNLSSSALLSALILSCISL